MRKNLNSVLFLIISLALATAWGQTKGQSLKGLSSVELQWEDTPGAFMYEVEVYNSKSKLLKRFVSKTSLFKFKSTSGKIKLRGRVLDAYGKKGLWSEMIETQVPPDDVKLSDTTGINAKADPKTLKGKVNVKWTESIQAKKYLVKIYDKDHKVIEEKITIKLFESFDLEVGSYQYSITPIGNDQIYGKETIAQQPIEVESAQLPSERFIVGRSDSGTLQIKMPAKPGLKIFGELEYAHHMAEDWKPVLNYSPFSETVWSPDVQLKPGRYRIGFWVARAGWVDSAKFRHEFVIKPTEADIINWQQ